MGQRYGGKKLERTRDLFEQCLETCPEQYAKPIFLLYAKLEEQHGLARRAMAVYDRAVDKVEKKERYAVFNIYLKKAAEIYGVTKTRAIYEKAIELLGDTEARQMSMRFAELETKLGEIDRARAIYSHCSQMCDPRVAGDYWQAWKDFEVKHGNEDTLREMLRIKRSVSHTFNTQINMMSAQMLSSTMQQQANDNIARDEMKALEENASVAAAAVPSSEASKKENVDRNIMFVRGETQSKSVEEAQRTQLAENPDEIDLDDDDDEDDDDDDNEGANGSNGNGDGGPIVERSVGKVEKQAIPAEVFGSLKKDDD